MFNKKIRNLGQGTVGGLVVLIAVFIILFVLLMPECDRCNLLKTECPSNCDDSFISDSNDLLLSEKPGKVSPLGLNKSVRNLEQVNLFFSSEPLSKRIDTDLEVSEGWFGGSDKTVNFEIEDLNNLEGASLFLDVVDSKGKLILELNEHQIYFEEIDSPKLEIIELPLVYLQKENKLKIYTNSPSLAFWSRNFYNINDVVFKGELNKLNAKVSRHFSISSAEKSNLLGSRLEFFAFCDLDTNRPSTFKIFLNDNLVRNEYLECEGQDRIIALNRDFFKEGLNEFVFVIDSGKFILSEMKLTNTYVGNINPVYSFDVSDEALRGEISLKIEFTGSGSKKASINVNDNKIDMDTSAGEFEVGISNYAKAGENIIEIIPENSFEIKRILIKSG